MMYLKQSILFLLVTVSLLCNSVSAQSIITSYAAAEAGKRNFQPAITELTALLDKDANNQAALTYRASIYSAAAQHDKAFTDAQRALSLNPGNINALMVCGVSKASVQEWPAAFKFFNDVLSIKPDLTKALVFRGKVYDKMNNNDLAIADMSRVIQLEASNLEAYINRGLLYAKVKKYSNAIDDLTYVVNNTKPEQDLLKQMAVRQRGQVWLAAGNKEMAARDLGKSDDNAKNNYEVPPGVTNLDGRSEPAKSTDAFENVSTQNAALLKEIEQLKAYGIKVNAAAADALAAGQTVKDVPAKDYYKEATAKKNAQPKIKAAISQIQAVLAATAAFNSDLARQSRSEWEKILPALNNILDRCSDYNIVLAIYNGDIGASDEMLKQYIKLLNQGRTNKDAQVFNDARTKLINNLKDALRITYKADADLQKLGNPRYEQHKKGLMIIADSKQAMLTQVEGAKF